MDLFRGICKYLSHLTMIDEVFLELFLNTTFVILLFIVLRQIGKLIISSRTTGRKEFLLTQSYFLILNLTEIFMFLVVWDNYSVVFILR